MGTGVVIEEHVTGHHYRIQCVAGRFAGCVQRRPPQVTGDGRLTIGALVEVRNREPERRPLGDLTSLIHYLVPDDVYLRSRGWTLESTPTAGEHVTINPRMVAVVGADRIDVSAEVHGDTVSACERFAARHRLFLAGFDFITPDICVSCHTAGAFNEVNVCNVDFGMVEHCNVGRQWPVARDIWNRIDFDDVAGPECPRQ